MHSNERLKQIIEYGLPYIAVPTARENFPSGEVVGIFEDGSFEMIDKDHYKLYRIICDTHHFWRDKYPDWKSGGAVFIPESHPVYATFAQAAGVQSFGNQISLDPYIDSGYYRCRSASLEVHVIIPIIQPEPRFAHYFLLPSRKLVESAQQRALPKDGPYR